MKFEEAVAKARTLTDLRRVASAHVVDHRQLSDAELRAGVVKVKPQYLHAATVKNALEDALFRNPSKDTRVITRLMVIDVLLDQFEFSLPYSQTEERVIELEQSIVDRSNETELLNLACGDRGSQRFRDFELYYFVLQVAWEHHETVSPDEANLLLNLRRRLKINEWDHRLLEAKLRKYPKPNNEVHTRQEIAKVRIDLQALGLVFPVRLEDGTDLDVIPGELAAVVRSILRVEMRSDAYRQLIQYRPLRRRAHLTTVLEKADVKFGRYDTVETLVERVLRDVPPSASIAKSSPVRYGLTSDQLSAWCRELGISAAGPVEDRVARVVNHFDQLRPRAESEVDQRELWYQFFEELAFRDRDALRSQHVIEKDLEIEAKFEAATEFLFSERLNHKPLKQSGSDHPDGLISLRADYLMWDNKSKERPGLVSLKEHLPQFHRYMEAARLGEGKEVPIFLVIGPDFTPDSDVEAIRYHAEHFSRNVVLVTAAELKSLAEEWSGKDNSHREEPFPLPLLAASGRYSRQRLGKLG